MSGGDVVKNIIDVVGTVIMGVGLYFTYSQIKATLEWNKKKTAEEALTQIVSGKLVKCYDEVYELCGWNLLTDQRLYDQVVEAMPPEQRDRLDKLLMIILRQLETVAIKIDHDVYDESLCFDYLFSLVINTHRRCLPFIQACRIARNEPRLFEHVGYYANKWSHDVESERRH